MSCCCVSSGGIGKFFGHFARRYRRRYARRGFEATQRQLLEGLHQAGVAGARLLEIGCGVGYLHQQLLRDGAMRALGVDISEAMLAQARELARTAGLADRAEYRQGILSNWPGTSVRWTSPCSTRWCAVIPTPRRW